MQQSRTMDFSGSNQRSSNQDVNNQRYDNQEFNDTKTSVTSVHLNLNLNFSERQLGRPWMWVHLCMWKNMTRVMGALFTWQTRPGCQRQTSNHDQQLAAADPPYSVFFPEYSASHHVLLATGAQRCTRVMRALFSVHLADQAWVPETDKLVNITSK